MSAAVDSMAWAKVMRRLLLPVAVLSAVILWFCFGVLRVPKGMDTTPSVPGGSLCLVDKRQAAVVPGALVFVDVGDGATLLTRVVAVDHETERFTCAHDEETSRFASYAGELPLAAVRSTVLATFLPDQAAEEVPR